LATERARVESEMISRSSAEAFERVECCDVL